MDLECPSCRRPVLADPVPRRRRAALPSRSARCPYPSCATILTALMHWTDEAPAELFTLPEMVRVSRRALLAQIPGFFLAEGILALAFAFGAYALDQLAILPVAATTVQQLGRIGIAVGACGLILPATIAAPALIVGLVRRWTERRRTLARLARAAPTEGLRLRPCPRTYRS